MMNARARGLAALGAAILGAGGLVVLAGPTAIAARPNMLQVGCGGASSPTIEDAVAAANPGDTIVVCPGTYGGNVLVSKAVTIVGQQGATVDATGDDNGFMVSASGATVEGFTVENAIGEGILVAPANKGATVSHVTISDNTVTGNDQGNPTGAPISNSSYAECNAAHNVPGDCGEGIHLESVTSSAVAGNTVTGNSGGVLVTDEMGPSAHDVIEGNTITDNVLDCGVTLAGHAPGAMGGVSDIQVLDNTITGNGTKGQGAGVLLATEVPSGPYGAGGAVFDNLVSGNTISGNGLAGVTVHSHAAGEDLNNNTIVHNTIGTNNLVPDNDFGPALHDSAHTGVLVATLSGIHITIAHNTIEGNTDGVWLGSPAGVQVLATGLPSNLFGASTTTAVVTVTS